MRNRFTLLGESDEDSPAMQLIKFLKSQDVHGDAGLEEFSKLALSLLVNASDNGRLWRCLKRLGWLQEKATFQLESGINVQEFLIALYGFQIADRALLAECKPSKVNAAFVPNIVCQHVTNNVPTDKNLSPFSRRFHGVCMAIEISGWTKMIVEHFIKNPRDVHSLEQVINEFMGEVTAIVYMFGGDIIKISGNFLWCIFPSEEMNKDFIQSEPPVESSIAKDTEVSQASVATEGSTKSGACPPLKSDSSQAGAAIDVNSASGEMANSSKEAKVACLQAARCAMALKNINVFDLGVRIALTYGRIGFAVLGGLNDSWEYLIAGSCIQEISQCIDEAKEKEVVMSNDFSNHLRAFKLSLSIKTYESSNVLLERMVDPTNICDSLEEHFQSSSSSTKSREERIPILNKFIPSPVSASTVDGKIPTRGELREVTSVFIKWESYDSQKHKDLTTLQEFMLETQKILVEYGGYLHESLIDDKGCMLVAMWGVPSATYSDNTYRALNASIKLHYSFHRKHMTTSIGLTTGNVYTGITGSSLRMDYSVLGPCVNLAFRLMEKSFDEISVDQNSYSKLPKVCTSHLRKKCKVYVDDRVEQVEIYSYFHSDNLLIREYERVQVQIVRESVKKQFLSCLDLIMDEERKSIDSQEAPSPMSYARSFMALSTLINPNNTIISAHNSGMISNQNSSYSRGKGGGSSENNSMYDSDNMSTASKSSSKDNVKANAARLQTIIIQVLLQITDCFRIQNMQ